MKRFLRIGQAQLNFTVGELEANQKKMVEYIRQARKQKADILVFPELAICGYPPEDLLLKKHFIDDSLKALTSVIKNAAKITVIAGFVDRDTNGNIYNAAAVIYDGIVKGVYHKIELPNYGVFDEKRYFSPGKENLLFKLGEVVFGLSICEDIWRRDGPCQAQADSGARLLINISASPYYAGKISQREKIVTGCAKDTKAFVCYTNLVGAQDELVFDGASFISNPQGEIIASGKQFEEELLITDIDIDSLVRDKAVRAISKRLKLITISDKLAPGKRPALPPRISRRPGRVEEVYNALVLGTRDYLRKNGFKKAVIGLSGGVDSALTATIASDAIGRENLICVSMPSRFSSKQTQSDARILAKNLGVRLITIPIARILAAYLSMLSDQFKGLKQDVAEENIQARIRGNLLMALSNKFHWLVLTTGNKSETAVGYCTLYGDMAGGFAVIKDVPKTMVYELAQFRNKTERKEIIPESILSREPSAELRAKQKDSDTLPPYPVLDPILKSYIEEDKGLEEIIAQGKDSRVVKEVIQMVDRNEYKRRQSSPGVRITPKAFGKDRRLPITNRYKQFF